MSDQFVAEIRIFPMPFAPYGWQLCNGQILAISQFAALFSLIGVSYGGNGTNNFGLPNLQASVANRLYPLYERLQARHADDLAVSLRL